MEQTPIKPVGVIVLEKKLGHGAENNCYQIDTGDSEQKKVLKIPRLFGRVWQTQGREFIERCLAAMEQIGIPAISTTVREKIIVQLPNGSLQEAPLATEHDLIRDMDDKVLSWDDLTDPETGPRIIQELIEMLEKAVEIYENEELGIDLYGGTLAITILKGCFRNALISTLESNQLTQSIAEKIEGVRGEISNLVMIDQKIYFSDHGMFDLSRRGKFKSITESIYHAVICGTKTLLDYVNARHQERIDSERIASVKYHGPKALQRLINFLLLKVMIPLYERHENRRRGVRSTQKTGIA